MLTTDEVQQLREIIREEIKPDLQDLKTDVSGLKTDVNGLKVDVHGLKTDVQGLKKDVQTLKKNDQKIRKDMKLMLGYLERTDSKLHKRVTRIEDHLHLPAFE